MGRSGYSEDVYCDDNSYLLWPNIVRRSIQGKRGQEFLMALATAMDAMPEKRLIAGQLVTPEGECCTMGVLCKARGIDVSKVDYDCQEDVAKLLNIAPSMAREIAYFNDDDFGYEGIKVNSKNETPEERWTRMRKWVDENLKASK